MRIKRSAMLVTMLRGAKRVKPASNDGAATIKQGVNRLMHDDIALHHCHSLVESFPLTGHIEERRLRDTRTNSRAANACPTEFTVNRAAER